MRAVIINPASASGRTADRWRSIVRSLEQQGLACETMLTTGPGDGIDIARRAIADGMRELIVLGGDGTLGEVVAGCVAPDGTRMLADDLVLSVIHQGTGGDLARGLGIPKDVDGAIEVASTGVVRRIDAGVARFSPLPLHEGDVAVRSDPGASDGERLRGFISCSNIGLGAEVVEKVTGKLKRLGSNGAFAAATVSSLARNRPRPVHIVTDEGLDVQTSIVDVIASNNRYMGGGMLVAPDASFDDGQFDLVVIGAASRARLLRTFPKIYKGTHVNDPLVRVEKTAGFRIDAAGDTPEGVVLDGDLVGRTPASFHVLASAIGVRVPA